jgi:signal peptidase I
LAKSEAMLPTIAPDDRVDITKSIDSLTYGDMVIYEFDMTTSGINFAGPSISRIVGLPGDTIAVENEICILNGKKQKFKLYRKQCILPEKVKVLTEYISEYVETYPDGRIVHIYKYKDEYEERTKNVKPTKIPENHYFLMADFRSNAYDSRHIGAIPKEKIIGKVLKIKPKK